MPVLGLLFDLDGTLVDTERLQWTAYARVLAEHGVAIDLETYRGRFIAAAGGPEWACTTYGLGFDAATLRARKAVVYRRLIADGVSPMPGAREALARLHPGHRLAVATNTARAEVAVILRHGDLGGLLDAVVAREDYPAPKPAPDAYLAAAAALGLAPAECVVVEDTPRGLQAGRAAGMRVVVVPSDLTRDQDYTGASARLAHLDALTPALLASLPAA
ncbi:MAG: HAD family phosphatase [bacterium]|nr:HAD family phosphatase [bacterium]